MARHQAQWYETADGKRRLQVEHEAIERFNRRRRADLRLVGRKHPQGHLIVEFAFQPLATRADLIVRGELILSSRHPEIEATARITSPRLQAGKHLLLGEGLRSMALDKTVPLSWLRAADGVVLCMWVHDQGPNAWDPSFTVVTVVNNVESWYLNYMFWQATGRWVFDEAKPRARRRAPRATA
jgi:hypothetical protein